MVVMGFTEQIGEESKQFVPDIGLIEVNEKDKKPGVHCVGLK